MIDNNIEAFFDDDCFFDAIESCGVLIHDYMIAHPLLISKPNFHEMIRQECHDLFLQQLEDVHIPNISEHIDDIVSHAHQIYFTKIIPLRSFKYTFADKVPNIKSIREKLYKLRNVYQPEQRTTDWYLFRYNLLTASNVWKALDSQSNKNSLIYEKCKPLNVDKYCHVNIDTPLHWGQKYEPLSVLLYENIYQTKIEDFGCIKHGTYLFLGASPDGINVDETSNRFGRMLEVKNIVNREITGIPKQEYWVQMQMQMNVCELDECDFLETRFIEYEDETDYLQDGTFSQTIWGKKKGIIMMFMTNEQNIIYEYNQLHSTQTEFDVWEVLMMEKHVDKTWLKNCYWRLDQISCVLVLRNKQWFASAVVEFENIWNIILYEREHGYEHRGPKKRIKQPALSKYQEKDINHCVIKLCC